MITLLLLTVATCTTTLASSQSTHTVFLEYGTAVGCGYCKYAHAALKNLYVNSTEPFYYVSLVDDKNTHAAARNSQYNIYGFPTVFFDGGQQVIVGGYSNISYGQQVYEENISVCANRPVPDIDASLSVTWLGNASMTIEATVQNNQTSVYEGYLRVFVTEIRSSMGWKDSGGNTYTFAFLDYAFTENIMISPADTWENTVTWDGHLHSDGHGHSFDGISYDNIMVIATVFNASRHQGYADPPHGNPFDAYYVDETVAAVPILNSQPPETPQIHGATLGKTGVTYNFSVVTTDPEGDSVYYWIDWGDQSSDGWIGPYPSGQEIQVSHRWAEQGAYSIIVKARDVHDAPSPWSDPFTIEILWSELEIESITGGLMTLQATLLNNRSEVFSDIEWNLSVAGGLFHLLNDRSDGVIESLAAGDTAIVQLENILFGFGKISVSVSVHVEDMTITRHAKGFVVGIFVVMLPKER